MGVSFDVHVVLESKPVSRTWRSNASGSNTGKYRPAARQELENLKQIIEMRDIMKNVVTVMIGRFVRRDGRWGAHVPSFPTRLHLPNPDKCVALNSKTAAIKPQPKTGRQPTKNPPG